ncbi:uncharacterized protein [Heterodontus francisci]|uniref:uncharacterized protein isoform X1 n=1 Tax=Heterodontus francisci TaxID=7792 RepID=UPI00355AE325
MATAGLVLNQKLTIKYPHTVHTLLFMKRVSQMTAARWTRWTTVLEAPNVQIVRASPVNLATVLPWPEEMEEEEHDCVEVMEGTEEVTLAAEEALLNPDLIRIFLQRRQGKRGGSWRRQGERVGSWTAPPLLTTVHGKQDGQLQPSMKLWKRDACLQGHRPNKPNCEPVGSVSNSRGKDS